MAESIQIDVQVTPQLWLPDERAWRVSALRIPGAKATDLLAGSGPLTFNVNGDRIVWIGDVAKRPTQATLHITIPGDLHPAQDLEAKKLELDTQKAADATKLQKWTIGVGVITALIGVLGTLAAKAMGEPEKKGAACMTPADARECRQSLLRLQTLSTTAANSDDLKKAVQREIVACQTSLEKVQP